MTFRGDRPGAVWEFESATEEAAISVSGPIAVMSFHILLDLALAGLGFAPVPNFMLGDHLKSGRLVRCLPGFRLRPHPVFLTYRQGARRIARIDAMINLSEEVIPGLLSRKAALRAF